MPRRLRIQFEGAIYHVMAKGNGRQRIVHDDPDRQRLLDDLRRTVLRCEWELPAFVFMPNHFHLVVWPSADGDLSRWMHWLLTAHIRRYQRHYHATGHVWQGRFNAFPIQDDDHLLVVLRYV